MTPKHGCRVMKRRSRAGLVYDVKKKSNTTYTPKNSDLIKVPLEIKPMVSKLIKMNVDNNLVY
jgi:hypothetical protein